MRKMLLWMLAVAVLLGVVGVVPALAEMKPVVTVSFSGYDKTLSNIGLIGKLGGNPDMGKQLEMILQMVTQGKGLAGLDKTQPWGGVLLSDGEQEYTAYVFLPATDLKQLMELAKANPQLGGMIQEKDGVYEIQTPAQSLFIKQKGKWAVAGKDAEGLDKAPADPLALFGDLPKRYDLAVSASVKNLPEQFRQQLTAQLKAGAEVGLQQMPGESDDEYAVRANMAKQAMEQITRAVNELDQIVLGWNVDHSTSTTYLDLEITAQDGTKLAEQFAQMKMGKTNFAGFLAPKATMTGNWTNTLSDEDVTRTKGNLAELRKRAVKELENQGLSEEETKLATELLGEVMDILEKSVETKKVDGGMTVTLEAEASTLVMGGAIAEGAKLEGVVKKLVAELQKSDPETAKSVKLNADAHEGVRFHTLSLPTPSPDLAKVIGETLNVVVGIGDDKAFVAVGRDAAKLLKQVLDTSKSNPGREVAPAQLSLSATQIAKFIAKVADDDDAKAKAETAAAVLAKAGDKDHITLTAKPIAKGMRVRLELEDGLLKALGSMGGMMAPGGMPPGAMPPGGGS